MPRIRVRSQTNRTFPTAAGSAAMRQMFRRDRTTCPPVQHVENGSLECPGNTLQRFVKDEGVQKHVKHISTGEFVRTQTTCRRKTPRARTARGRPQPACRHQAAPPPVHATACSRQAGCQRECSQQYRSPTRSLSRSCLRSPKQTETTCQSSTYMWKTLKHERLNACCLEEVSQAYRSFEAGPSPRPQRTRRLASG